MPEGRIVWLSVRTAAVVVVYHLDQDCPSGQRSYARIRSFEEDMEPAAVKLCVFCYRRRRDGD